ncbi:MAG: T9SS type A sorting domain-containing protein [Ignavibacteria bacterium]
MRKALLLVLFSFFIVSGYAQEVKIENAIPTGINTVQSPLWGNDVVISNFEPIGPITAIKAASGTIYVAINDTLATSNLGLIIMQSTNDGNTWSLYPQGINLRTQYTKLKLISAGGAADSIYLFMQIGSTVYSWNFRNQTLNDAGYGGILSTFDVVGATNGALYYFYDTIPTGVRRYSSIDGGLSWINRGLITSSGVRPKVATQTGDTIILNYYGPVLSDTVTSKIRAARYRQTAPGTLTSSGFQDVVTELVAKTEFKSVMFNGVVWFIYTSGTTGAIDIKGRISTNAGANYDAAIDIAANPNVDEYWFDVNFFSGGGFDLSYYSDSLQAGAPTNNTDKMMYCFATVGGSSFGSPTQISSNPPSWSDKGYIPVICEIPPSDLGIVWVGMNAGAKLYWDRYSAITNIGNSETPVSYSLSQNYPNPFNPTTKINFNLAKNGIVTLKVYNILGKEVAKLVSGNYNAGSYSIDFNASKLSSGAYFYSIEVNGFKDIKKMMLVK